MGKSDKKSADKGKASGWPDWARDLPIRVGLVGLVFAGSMGAIGYRLAEFAARDQQAPPSFNPAELVEAEAPRRREITDRNGIVLASNLRTFELYFDTRLQKDPHDRAEAARAIAALFPQLQTKALIAKFSRDATVPVIRQLSPRQVQAAHDLGFPGLYASPRSDRIYPIGRDVAHLLGYTDIDGKGQAGLEAALDGDLAKGGAEALVTSIDLRVQRAVRQGLAQGIKRMHAKGGNAILMDVHSGEIASMVSLPDYDPANRPKPPMNSEEAEISPLFNRAITGRYELGSVFKIFTWALALEQGIAAPEDILPAPKAFVAGGYRIGDDHPIRHEVSVAQAFAKSSNIVAAKFALTAGRQAQYDLFEALGLHRETPIELIEARGKLPLWSDPWTDAVTASTSYGHGVAPTPLHVAAAVASIINGGTRVEPTLLRRNKAEEPGERVISESSSRAMRAMMRLVVTDGTGRRADVPGYEIGGKTGTADKPNPQGGYYRDRVMASFVAGFPMSNPRYVLLVTLDEPEERSAAKPRRSAGLTAAPVAGAIIGQIAPLLGLAPVRESYATSEIAQ
ncbi:MAG: penicillin-binding protein 2 [Neomegalonema sp.]|nr:penicillin-binding protein 2 [Neomegalonema sp.]